MARSIGVAIRLWGARNRNGWLRRHNGQSRGWT